MKASAQPDPTPFAGATAAYCDGPPRQVPGFSSLHRMVGMLLAERATSEARMLVLGAGGGLELRALAEDYPGWSFDGVDPSADMLDVARATLAEYLPRVRLHHGYVEDAPEGPFDGATCLLTLHFVPRAQRLQTLRQLHRRLAPGAPLVVMHLSFPQSEPERTTWIDRHLAFSGNAMPADSARQAMRERLTILDPDEDEAMLREAGFAGIALFYAGLSFRGWVGYA